MVTETIYRINPVEWNPSPVVALATSIDGSQVAAARGDGSLEVWLVSSGSVGWHCLLTIHGEPNSRISSLIWCPWGPRGCSSLGWLISSSIDGSVSEWDLYDLKQKIVLDSIGVSIWKLAAEPCNNSQFNVKKEIKVYENGNDIHKMKGDEDDEHSDSEDDINRSDSAMIHEDHGTQDPRLAIACDDGCVRIYTFDLGKLIYNKTLPRVTGRVLSVAWSLDARRIYSGGSDGFIRCWDANLAHEIYRITVGRGGLAIAPALCIWSLLVLRCGTIVSADSSGSVQFWDSQFATLLQTHSYHKGDVNALAAAPTHNRVFSAGSDGQVILYKSSSDTVGSGDDKFASDPIQKWIYVGSVRAHTHDVGALTVAVPISHEDALPDKKVKRVRGREKPFDFSYHKWADSGVPMLISAGDDTKLIAYSAREFTKFSPHDICPAPHRMPIQLALKTFFDRTPLLLVQASRWLDIYRVRVRNGAVFEVSTSSSDELTTDLVARIKCKASRKIICSTISSSGTSFAYSDHVKSNLFELKQSKSGKNVCTVEKRKLLWELPYAHCMVFSSDSSKLLIAAYDRRIYVVDVGKGKLVHVFTPSRTHHEEKLPPSEPPSTKMFTSIDDHWLAAINCFGDVYIFNLETLRQHWFISMFDGASVTAGGFTPQNSNILIISTSSNHVYAFDVEAKQLGEWSMQHTFSLPRRYQEFPGEVIGLSFPPSASSSRVIVYSPRARCLIDFGMPVGTERADGDDLAVRNNFKFCHFSEPVLFVGHLSENNLLVIDKPWMEVVKTLDTPPVHRHIYGT